MVERTSKLVEGDLTERVIGICIDVSRELGNGFLESVYLKSLVVALTQAGIKCLEQHPLKVMFRNHLVGDFYPDLLVEDKLIVELKAVRSITAEHEAQLLNYLKATGKRVGLLVNFGKSKVEWKRMVF